MNCVAGVPLHAKAGSGLLKTMVPLLCSSRHYFTSTSPPVTRATTSLIPVVTVAISSTSKFSISNSTQLYSEYVLSGSAESVHAVGSTILKSTSRHNICITFQIWHHHIATQPPASVLIHLSSHLRVRVNQQCYHENVDNCTLQPLLRRKPPSPYRRYWMISQSYGNWIQASSCGGRRLWRMYQMWLALTLWDLDA